MNNLKRFLSVLFILTIMAAPSFAQVDFMIPDNPEAVILSLDSSGGFRMAPPAGFERKPSVQIFASGKVVKNPALPNLPSGEITLTEDQLRALLNLVVEENKFYEIEADDIQKQIKESGQRIMIADAPNTDISIDLGLGQHSVSVYALSFVHQQFPGIEPLQRLEKIRMACNRLGQIATLGGFEIVENAAAEVNAELEKSHPNVPKITKDDMSYGGSNANGQKSVTFVREFDNNGKKTSLRASFVLDPGGSSKVHIHLTPLKK